MSQDKQSKITLPDAAIDNMSEVAKGQLREHAPHLVTERTLLINFDDLAPGLIPDGFAGFNWDWRLDSNPLNSIQYTEQALSVGDNPQHGFEREALNIYAQEYTYISKTDGDTFDFISFDAIDWYPPSDAEKLILTGYVDGEVVQSMEIVLADTMTTYQLNFADIDMLEIRTNAQDEWYDSNRGHFWMDNLLFVV